MKRPACIVTFLVILAGIGSAQEINVTTPWSGLRWNIGDAQDIRWTSTGVTQPNVKIMLWRGETNILGIVDSTPNNGRYRWRIPGNVAPGPYKIRVRAIGATTLGISAEFEITDAKITVTQPNTSVTWKPGETHLIQWTHTSPMDARVWIKLFPIHEGLSIYSIADITENDGLYSWTVPGNVPPGEYQLILRTIDNQVVCEGPNISVGSGPARIPHISERVSALLKRPALSISDVRLKAEDDGFVILFGYKNSGTGPLPKSSEMPVKPDYRVLIDNREVSRGSLIFPAFQAPPGWQVPTFFGGEIKFQTSGLFDYNWTIGNLVTVKINENKVNGMAADSQTYNLKPMALNNGYDVMITGATLDWSTGVLRTDIRIDGDFGSYDQIHVFDAHTNVLAGTPVWEIKAFVVPGRQLYTLSKKRNGLNNQAEHKVSIGVILLKGSDTRAHIKDIEHRNNIYDKTFRR